MNGSDMVLYSQEQGVGVITLNRAPANAYNLTFHHAFYHALCAANEDKSVNAVIIKSASEKFFCAGADIKEFQQNSVEKNQSMVDKARDNLAFIHHSSKIFIAQLSGHTMGGGLEIALACDLRFASAGSYFIGMSEIRLGLIPGNGGTQHFVRLAGTSKALEFLLTGDHFSPQEALEMGLINHLFSPQEIDHKVFEYASKISKGPALAIAATKRAVLQGREMIINDGLKLEQRLSDQLCQTEDAKEGFLAFVEKRAPQFKGC